MTAWDSTSMLRGLLGDTDPENQFFDDGQIAGLLLEGQGNLNRSAYTGWTMKAASYADLITVTEGNAMRQMSDLLDHALTMVKHFQSASSDLTAGRTRVGRIVRRF